MKLKELASFISEIKNAYRLWLENKQNLEEAQQVYQELKQYNLLDEIRCLPFSNPARNIGSAIKLAKQYNVTLHSGTCYGDCRAELSKDDWIADIHPNVYVWDYCDFILKPREEIDRINAWHRNPEMAICRCLIRAKKSGVI